MLKSSISTVLTSVAMAGVALVSAIMTARALGVEGRGVLAAALLALSLSRGAGQLGLGQSFSLLVRRREIGNPSRRALSSSGVVALSGGLISFSLIALAPVTDDPGLGVSIVFTAVIASVADFQVNALRIDSSLKTFNYARMGFPALTTTLIGASWWWLGDLTPSSVVICTTVSALTISLATAPILTRAARAYARPNATPVPWRRYLTLAASFQGLALLGLLLNNVDMIYMMFIGSAEAFGLYSAAYGLSRLISPLPLAVGNALFARYVGHSRDDQEAVETALLVFRLLFLPLALIGCIGTALAPFAIPALLGKEFEEAWPIFSILLFEAALGGLAYLLAQHFQAEGRVGIILKRHLASFVPILCLIWFIPRDRPAIGLACLILLSAGVRLLMTLRQFKQVYPLQPIMYLPRMRDIAQLRNL